MFTETASLIDFGPYIPLVAFPEARETIISQYRRRVLIDVGANGFFASPKVRSTLMNSVANIYINVCMYVCICAVSAGLVRTISSFYARDHDRT